RITVQENGTTPNPQQLIEHKHFFSFFEAFAYSSLKRFVSLRLVAMSSLSSIGKHPRRAKPTGRDLVLVSSMTSKPKLHAQKIR
ncbi:hypothetical protein, partial [Bifidobacterium longum]|uniref:hypothetical protein n=1 Tax=Bifidobacterium longum TaxID=216816 RepID=UPI001A95595F